MEKLKSIEVKALKTLWKSSKGLDAFSFFRRLDIPFSDFSKAIRVLSKELLIEEVQEDFFLITQKGVLWLLQDNSVTKQRHWRAVPDRFKSRKISTSDFYVPSIRLLDDRTFKKD